MPFSCSFSLKVTGPSCEAPCPFFFLLLSFSGRYSFLFWVVCFVSNNTNCTINMAENRGPQLLAVNIFFSTLTGIIVLLRCYTRVVIVKAFGADDWIMLVAMVC